MLHLHTDRLAELAEDEPTAAEAEHLSECPVCASERAAHKRLLALAGDSRLQIAPPLTSWDALSTRLRAEGLITTSAPPTSDERIGLVSRAGQRLVARSGLRAAAALLLLAGGAAYGRYTAGARVIPIDGADRRGEASARPVADSGPAFRTTDDALAALARAQREYDRAAAYLSAHDSTSQSPDASELYRTRLAALDEMAEASRQALYEAPSDPVINQYYLSTLGAREATLRQLGTVLPTGTRLTRY